MATPITRSRAPFATYWMPPTGPWRTAIRDRRILPISVVKVLVEFYGADVISKTVQIADTIVTVEKDRRPSLHVVK